MPRPSGYPKSHAELRAEYAPLITAYLDRRGAITVYSEDGSSSFQFVPLDCLCGGKGS